MDAVTLGLAQASAKKRYDFNLNLGLGSVMRYGANGLGQADDSAALQAAHDALPARGGVIFAPGKHRIDSGVTFTKPIRLEGTGSGDHYATLGNSNVGNGTYDPTLEGTSVYTTSPTLDMITVNAPGFTASDIFFANTASSTPTAGSALRITRGDATHLDRVQVNGFWNNISFEQSEYATINQSLLMDPVNFGLWIRNLVNSDQGDMTLTACTIAYSGRVARTGTAGIQWESGGGLKLFAPKINMGAAGVGKFNAGVIMSAAANVHTSVFLLNGGSIENTNNVGIQIGTQDATATFGKIQIFGTEFYNVHVAAAIAGASTTNKITQLAIGALVIDAVTTGIRLSNVARGVILPNVIFTSGTDAIQIQTGAESIRVSPQTIVGTTGNMISDGTTTQFSDHTTQPVDVDYRDKRVMPSTTSSTTYSNLYTIPVVAFGSGEIELRIYALVQGKGGGFKRVRRVFTRGSTGASTVTAVDTDVAVGIVFDVNFDTSSAAGNVVVQVRINSTAGGTDINGHAEIVVRGMASGLTRN